MPKKNLVQNQENVLLIRWILSLNNAILNIYEKIWYLMWVGEDKRKEEGKKKGRIMGEQRGVGSYWQAVI